MTRLFTFQYYDSETKVKNKPPGTAVYCFENSACTVGRFVVL